MSTAIKKRAFFTTKAPLEDIPREWLRYVEPHVTRGPGFGTCWIWTGPRTADGYPVMNYQDPHTRKQAKIYVHRFVANIFFKMPEGWFYKRQCQTMNCVNPAHYSPTNTHPTKGTKRKS